jgi:hypothetical protein
VVLATPDAIVAQHNMRDLLPVPFDRRFL